jgi:hypothetical protein
VFDQSCENGKDCAAVSALAGATPTSKPTETSTARPTRQDFTIRLPPVRRSAYSAARPNEPSQQDRIRVAPQPVHVHRRDGGSSLSIAP